MKKTSTGTLTLKDDSKEAGSLTATGGNNAAGIGGGFQGNGENITITGGTVNATGTDGGAGIGAVEPPPPTSNFGAVTAATAKTSPSTAAR